MTLQNGTEIQMHVAVRIGWRVSQIDPQREVEKESQRFEKVKRLLWYNNRQDKDELYTMYKAGEQKRSRKLPKKLVASLTPALYINEPITRGAAKQWSCETFPSPFPRTNKEDKRDAKAAARGLTELMHKSRGPEKERLAVRARLNSLKQLYSTSLWWIGRVDKKRQVPALADARTRRQEELWACPHGPFSFFKQQ